RPVRREPTRISNAVSNRADTSPSWPSLAGMDLSGSCGMARISTSKSTEKEYKGMRLAFTSSKTSIELRGKAVPGAEDRQRKILGFDQEEFSRSHVLCIGAGGIISQVAPTLARKGIGKITLLDDDTVETSNLNRQRFYEKDVGEHKAVALARN